MYRCCWARRNASSGSSSNAKGARESQRYVAKLTQDAKARLPTVSRPPEIESAVPLHETLAAFRASHEENVSLQQRLRNKVKVCPNAKCSKACGYTLSNCNGCGTQIEDVQVSYNDNVFMCFILGIARSNFPLTISIRAQTPEFLCFDDILSMSVCHLNVIPTSIYIADLRYLFTDPERGLALVNQMFDMAASVATEQFWGNDDFRDRFFNDEESPQTHGSMAELVLCGMNFPPSMYQMHLQFIHAPMLPFHYALAQDGQHAQHRRFFPLDYLQRALALGEKAKLKVTEKTEVDEIIDHFNNLGVGYDESHRRALRNVLSAQERFSPWVDSEFTYQVLDGQVHAMHDFELKRDQDAKQLMADDTRAIANYGRPYDGAGKPTGVYYKFAKAPGEVMSFVPG